MHLLFLCIGQAVGPQRLCPKRVRLRSDPVTCGSDPLSRRERVRVRGSTLAASIALDSHGLDQDTAIVEAVDLIPSP
jgi:hypothetical protein